tara:strand:- start:1954 stop:3144 length:1191 start_codon:yes stop_codon:yes gene_type:complete
MRQHRKINSIENESLDLMTYNEARQICHSNDSRLYEPPLKGSKLPTTVSTNVSEVISDQTQDYWVGVRKFKKNALPGTGIQIFENGIKTDASGNIDKDTGVFRGSILIDPDSDISGVEYDSDITFSLKPSIGDVPQGMQTAYSIVNKDGSLIYSENDLFKPITGGAICEAYLYSKQSVQFSGDTNSHINKYTIGVFFGKHNMKVAQSMLKDNEDLINEHAVRGDKIVDLVNSFVENTLLNSFPTTSNVMNYYFWIKPTDEYNALQVEIKNRYNNDQVNILKVADRYLNLNKSDKGNILINLSFVKIPTNRRISGFIYHSHAPPAPTGSGTEHPSTGMTGMTGSMGVGFRQKVIIFFLIIGICLSLWAIFNSGLLKKKSIGTHLNDQIRQLTGNIMN